MNLSSVHRSELLNVKQESNVWVEDCRHFYWSVFLAQLLHSSQAEDEAMKCSDPIELSLIPTENIKKISLELLWQLQVRLNNDFGRDKTDEHVTTVFSMFYCCDLCLSLSLFNSWIGLASLTNH